MLGYRALNLKRFGATKIFRKIYMLRLPDVYYNSDAILNWVEDHDELCLEIVKLFIK